MRRKEFHTAELRLRWEGPAGKIGTRLTSGNLDCRRVPTIPIRVAQGLKPSVKTMWSMLSIRFPQEPGTLAPAGRGCLHDQPHGHWVLVSNKLPWWTMLYQWPPNSVLEEMRAWLPPTLCPAPFPGINWSLEQDRVRSLGPPRQLAPARGLGDHLETQMCHTKFIIRDKEHHQTCSTLPCKVITKGNLAKATRIFTVDYVL